jgi:hypothetical protein
MNNNSNANITDKKTEEKQIIPDQLNITIRTSIPGYQKIEYNPSMTIKGIDSKGVQFNPMIRLNKSIIDRMPAEYRTKQFFSKGLFQSLLIHNGGTPAKSLLQATRAGYVDNNIKVTLDAIFPVNSVIYIDKKPYAIGDIQWTTGDWKIEVKQKKEEIDPSKIRDPQLYTQLVREDIISGEKQLNELPESLVVGNNYSGPIPAVARGVKEVPISNKSALIKPSTITQTTALNAQPKLLTNVPSEKNEMLALPPPIPESLAVEEVSPDEERIFESLKGKYKINLKNTMQIREYFLDKNYYNLANAIYFGLPHYAKTIIINLYKAITLPKREAPSKSLSKAMYTASCNQIKVTESVSDGDCFFVAVAYGINVYNYENPLSKFYYQNYGKSQLYTATFLREIVLKYYEGLDETKKQELITVIGAANVNNLNKKFKKSIEDNPPLTDDDYIERLDLIYKSDENFFVLNPRSKPINIDEESTPFRLITTGQIPGYIKSKNYWGDQFAIEAICSMLKIYIIPINVKRIDKNIKLFAQPVEPDRIKNMCSNNVMFLYRKDLHYELITFKYKKQVQSKNDVLMKLKSVEKSFTIFKNEDLPPLFQILILIYGSNYILLDNNLQKNYGIYPEYMESFNNSLKKYLILKTPQSKKYIDLFVEIFQLKNPLEYYLRIQEPINSNPYIEDQENMVTNRSPYIEDQENMVTNSSPYIEDEEGNEDESSKTNVSNILTRATTKRIAQERNIDDVTGGAPPYRYQYDNQRYNYNPYGYRPQYDNRYILKKPEERNASKIAYGITIDMELHPGTSLSPEQINESKCNSRYNAIRKAFSEFTGRPYVIPPIYKISQTRKKVGGNHNKITRKIH